PLRQPHQNL
ncbi:siderophore-mediated iron transport protein, partial [Helicobacter pylori]